MNDTKYDFHFLIDEQTSLGIRLISEIISQAHEFRTDPKGYIKSSLANDCIGRKRGRLLLFGMAVGTIFLSSVLLMTILFYYSQTRRIQAENSAGNDHHFVPLFYPADIRPPAPKKSGDPSNGGGGGGDHESLPPSGGIIPPASLTDSIVRVTSHASTITDPVLPVMPTVRVNPDSLPPQLKDVPFGLPNANVGPPSDGPGEDKGIGSGKGHGVGPGKGPGVGPGENGGTGGGPNNNSSGGRLDESTPYSAKLVILSRPRPDYTEEARAIKAQGVVIIEATFKADGQIANVRVIRGLGFGLDQKAIEAVMQIKFRPAERLGRPTDSRQKISVSFQLL